MASLPVHYELPGFFFSHAPVPREEDRRSENKGKPFTLNELTWTYHSDESTYARTFEDGKIGVCGHIHKLQYGLKEPRLYKHYLFCDAGAGCSSLAPLVAVEVITRQVLWAWPRDVVNREQDNSHHVTNS
jgi:hypothetical protein